MLRIAVVTLFPEFFVEPLGISILGRATAKGLVEYHVVRLRDFTHDRHQTADDEPYGGGAGMVLRPEPFFEAVEKLRTAQRASLAELDALFATLQHRAFRSEK